MENPFKSKSLIDNLRQDCSAVKEEGLKQKTLSGMIGDVINRDGMSTAELMTVASRRFTDMWLSRHGEKKRFHLTGLAWQTTLHIAVAYGWEPFGTVNHHSADWSGSYLYGEGQTLTDKDAINFANALSRSVTDRFEKLNGTDLKNVFIERKGSAKFLKRVISYVKRGSFNIDLQKTKEFSMTFYKTCQGAAKTLH